MLSIMAKVTAIKPPEKLFKNDRQMHVTKQDCLSNSSGTYRIVLWADQVGALNDNGSYRMQNVVVPQYNKKYITVLQHDSELAAIPNIGEVAQRRAGAVPKLQGMPLQGCPD